MGPALHLGTLCFLAPRRPYVPPRYLLPLWPLLALLLALALAWTWRSRSQRAGMAAACALWLLPSLSVQAALFEPSRIGGFWDYRPAAWLAAEIGHVGYEEAPWVNDFVAARAPGATAGFGFAAGIGATDDLLAQPEDREALDAQALLARRQAWLGEHSLGADERRILHENIGWSLSVFAWERRGDWHALLTHLEGEDRLHTAQGLGRGLSMRGAEGCEALEHFQGPDRAALLAGARLTTGTESSPCAGERSAPSSGGPSR